MTCLCSRQSVGVSLDHAARLQESGSHDKIEEMGLKSKLTLRQGGGGKNLSVNLTLSVQWVGMDGFPKSVILKFVLLHKASLVIAAPPSTDKQMQFTYP